MPTRVDDLRELATSLSAVIEKARRLDLPTSAYILSMALLEVSQAMQAIGADEANENDATSWLAPPPVTVGAIESCAGT